MARAYYSLVTSLAELRLDDYKEPYRVRDFIAELDEQLLPRHLQYVRDLLGLQDGLHVVDVMMGREQEWVHGQGWYPFPQLRRIMQERPNELSGFPAEVAEGVSDRARPPEAADRKTLESLVLEKYYRRLLRHENRFISAYARFDYALRETIARVQAQQFSGAQDAALRAADDLPPVRRGVHTPWEWSRGDDDAVLNESVPHIMAQADLAQAEKMFDTLRWQKIDDLTVGSYFNIDVLLGYLLKLILVERWIRLEPLRGRDIFTQRTHISDRELAQ